MAESMAVCMADVVLEKELRVLSLDLKAAGGDWVSLEHRRPPQ